MKSEFSKSHRYSTKILSSYFRALHGKAKKLYAKYKKYIYNKIKCVFIYEMML